MAVKEEVKRTVIEKLECTEISNLTVGEVWQIFRDKLLNTLKEKCGTTKHGRELRKAVAWWNDMVKKPSRKSKSCTKCGFNPNWMMTM